ncbi:hypothetical protein Vretifemale_20719 [Volvox reticuliferus]|uniref:Uncharacterized protein n=1 Tax=Volvox reticuliferus TaxID=1737510 RepID=A0A8J4D169_9CHLO|nr:hypothetical protein Vretifemale_20719 [Volvox reticuliferus]
MLTTDDFYDILSANERLLEENRRVQRLATETPRSAKLQEHYLQQAARLGLIPARFTSPVRPSLSLIDSKPPPPAGDPTTSSAAAAAAAAAARKRPVPPPGYGGGRLSRDRVARELARAGSTQCNSAAAALAATEALYQQSSRHRFRSTNRASGSSDSDSSKDSSHSGSSSTTLTSTKVNVDNFVYNVEDANRSRNGGRRSSDEWFRSSVSMRPDGGGADGRDGRVRASIGPRRERGSARLASHLSARSDGSGRPKACSCGDGGGGVSGSGGSWAGRFLREPTPSFLRRWRAARKRKHAKKQVVRFLLRTSDELGEGEGKPSGGAAAAGASKGSAAGTRGSAGGNSGGGGANVGPGVVIAYPGSSVLFPPAALPYSLAEALEAVRRQTAHLHLGGEWGAREGVKGTAVATAAAAPSQPLTPPHHHPTRVVDLNNPTLPSRLDAATAAAAAASAPSGHFHSLQQPPPRPYQLLPPHAQLQRDPIQVQRPTMYGELDLAASPTAFSGTLSPSPYSYSASVGGASHPRWATAAAPAMGAMHPGGTAASPQTLSAVAAAAGTAVAGGPFTPGSAVPGGFSSTARGMGGIPGHTPFTAPRYPGPVRPALRDELGYAYDRYMHGSYDRSPMYGGVGVFAPGTPQGFASPVGLVGRGSQSAASFEADSVRHAWLSDLPDDPNGSPVLSDREIPSGAVSETGDIAAPAAATAVRPGDAYLQSLREHQSAIFRDVQVLMQRLADVRGRLGT